MTLIKICTHFILISHLFINLHILQSKCFPKYFPLLHKFIVLRKIGLYWYNIFMHVFRFYPRYNLWNTDNFFYEKLNE
jgi:hypothetical protein